MISTGLLCCAQGEGRMEGAEFREVTVIATDSNKGVLYFGAKGTNPENYGCRLKADGSFTFTISNISEIYYFIEKEGDSFSYVANK